MEEGLLEVHGDVDVDVDVFGDDIGGWKWKRVKKNKISWGLYLNHIVSIHRKSNSLGKHLSRTISHERLTSMSQEPLFTLSCL